MITADLPRQDTRLRDSIRKLEDQLTRSYGLRKGLRTESAGQMFASLMD